MNDDYWILWMDIHFPFIFIYRVLLYLTFHISILIYIEFAGLKRAWNGLRANSQESSNSLAHSESSPFADPESMLTFSEVDFELGKSLNNMFM